MLTVVKPEIMELLTERLMSNQDSQNTEELYIELFRQQPALKALILTALALDASKPWKDGYCKGVFQTWYLLNQQALIDDLENIDG